MRTATTFLSSILLGVALVAGACGDDGDTANRAGSTTVAPAEATTSTGAPADEPTTTTTAAPEPESSCPEPVAGATSPEPGIIAAFDAEADENPEGVAVDQSGNVYVSQIRLGRVLKLAPGAGELEVFGSIPEWTDDGIGFLGLAVDGDGNVYGASASASQPGVWKFDCRSGEATRVAGTEAMAFANGLAFDDAGNLYATDSASGADGQELLGAIWRMDADGSAEKWLESPMLGGTGAFDDDVGANGIAHWDGTLYVANSEKQQLLTVEVLADGSAGEIEVLADGFFADGIAVDTEGRVLAAHPVLSAVNRLNPDGTVDVLASGAADQLDLVSSITLGQGSTASTLYAVNLVHLPEFSTGVGPALVAIDLAGSAGS